MKAKSILFSLIATTSILVPYKYVSPNYSRNNSFETYNEKDVVDEIKVNYDILQKYIISEDTNQFIEIDIFNLITSEYDVNLNKGNFYIKNINLQIDYIEHIPEHTAVDHSHDKPNQSGYGTDHSGDITIHYPAQDVKRTIGNKDIEYTQKERTLILKPNIKLSNKWDTLSLSSGAVEFVITKFKPNTKFQDEWHIEDWDGEHEKDDAIKSWTHTLNLSDDGKRDVKRVVFSDGAEFNPYRNISFSVSGHNYKNPDFYNSNGQNGAWADNSLFGGATSIDGWNELSSKQKEDLKMKVDGEKTITQGDSYSMITESSWFNTYDEHDDRKGKGSGNPGGFWNSGSNNLQLEAYLDTSSNVHFRTHNIDSIHKNNTIYKMQIPNFTYEGYLTEIYDFSNDVINQDKTNERVLKERKLFTSENTTYLQLEEMLRRDVVSKDNMPTGDETKITFYNYNYVNGARTIREVGDKTKGLETGRILVKFGASGTNEHVIGESNLIELSLPYADRVETNSLYNKSINGNDANYGVNIEGENYIDLEVNTNTTFTIYSNELLVNDDNELLEFGKKDGINYYSLNINELMNGEHYYEERGVNDNRYNFRYAEIQIESNGTGYHIENLKFNNYPMAIENIESGNVFMDSEGNRLIPQHKIVNNIEYKGKNYGNGELIILDDTNLNELEINSNIIKEESSLASDVQVTKGDNIDTMDIIGTDGKLLQHYVIINKATEDEITYNEWLLSDKGSDYLGTISEYPNSIIQEIYSKYTYPQIIYDYNYRYLNLIDISTIDITYFQSKLESYVKFNLQDQIVSNETIFFDIEEQLVLFTKDLLPKENFKVTVLNDLHEKITYGTKAKINVKHLPTDDSKYHGERDLKITLYPKLSDTNNDMPEIYKLDITDGMIGDIQDSINNTLWLESNQLSTDIIISEYDNIIQNKLNELPMMNGYYDLVYKFEVNGIIYDSYESLIVENPGTEKEFMINLTIQTTKQSPLWYGYDLIRLKPNIK